MSLRNWRTLKLYHQAKAGLPVPADSILRDNLSAIEKLYSDHVRRGQRALMAAIVGVASRG